MAFDGSSWSVAAVSGADVVTALDAYFGNTEWRASAHFKGAYLNKAALDAAHATATLGNYAFVDAGAGNAPVMYVWDGDDNEWAAMQGSGGGGAMTGAEIEAVLDAYYGDTNWRTGGGASTGEYGEEIVFPAHMLTAANPGGNRPFMQGNVYTARTDLRVTGIEYMTLADVHMQLVVAIVTEGNGTGDGAEIVEVRGVGPVITSHASLGTSAPANICTATLTDPAEIKAGERFYLGMMKVNQETSGSIASIGFAAPDPFEDDGVSFTGFSLQFSDTAPGTVEGDRSWNRTYYFMNVKYEPFFPARADFDIASATTEWTHDGNLNIAFNLPEDIQSGDALMIGITCDESTNYLTTPTDWALHDHYTDNGVSITVFTKTADGTEGATVTITTSAGSNTHHTGHAIRARGADVSGDFFLASGYGNVASDTFVSLPELNGLYKSSLAVAIGVFDTAGHSQHYDLHVPNGMTEAGGRLVGGSGLSNSVVSRSAYEELGNGGSTGHRTFEFDYLTSSLSSSLPKPGLGVLLILKRIGDELDLEPKVETPVLAQHLPDSQSFSKDTAVRSVKGMVFEMSETRYLTKVDFGMGGDPSNLYRVYVVETGRYRITHERVAQIDYRGAQLHGPFASDGDRLVHELPVPFRMVKGRHYAVVVQTLTSTSAYVMEASVDPLATADAGGFLPLARVTEAVGTDLSGGEYMYDSEHTFVDLKLHSVSENAIFKERYTASVGQEDRDVTLNVCQFNGGVVEVDTSSAVVNVTIPSGIAPEHTLDLLQTGANDVQLVAGSGVTINSLSGYLKLAGQYATGRLTYLGNDTYSLAGDLKA